MLPKHPWVPRAIVVLAIAAICAAAFFRIDGAAITKDASHNARMAVNLRHHGVISMDWAAPYRPSMYREPLPVVVSAGVVAVIDSFLGKAEPARYLSGDRARFLKYQNILWLGVLSAVVFVAANRFTGAFYLSIAAATFSAIPFIADPAITGVNDLYTELPAAALLVLGSLLLAAATSAGSTALFVASGLCFGLLALTKGAFLYVSLGLLVVLALASLPRSHFLQRRARLLQSIAFAASVAILVFPWMHRNFNEFGHHRIADRGGVALYMRTLFNGMSAEEYRGVFYAWSSPRFRSLAAAFSGYGPQDLERGGRLQRLNDSLRSSFYRDDLGAEIAGRPEAALTYYRQARATRVKLEKEFAMARNPHPASAADNALQEMAVARIKADPFGSLRMVVPFLWSSAPITFPILLLAALYAASTKRYPFGMFVLPGLGVLSFYALMARFIPRFATVARPVAVVAVLVMLFAILGSTGLGKRLLRGR